MRARKSLLVFYGWLVLLGIGWPRASFSHGAYHDLVRKLTASLEKSPNDPELHFFLAQAHLEHGEWKLTTESLSRVEQLAPGKYPTRLLRGMALAGNGGWQAARVELDAVMETEPGNIKALTTRARVLLELGQREKALADWHKASALSWNADAEFFITWAQTLRNRNELAEAVGTVREGIARTGNDLSLLQLAVELEVAVKDYDSALKRVAALQGRWPSPEPWMIRRAEILHSAGRLDEEQVAWTDLRTHVLALPNLHRSSPYMTEVLARAEKALGIQTPAPVAAPAPAVRGGN